VVVAGVTRGAHIDRALRYRWCGVALAVASLGLMGGFTLLGSVSAAVGVGIAAFRLWRTGDRGSPTP
jgi:hypothetical protein